MKSLLILVLVLLSGCGSISAPMLRDTVIIRWVQIEDPFELDQVCLKKGAYASPFSTRGGCVTWSIPWNGICVIYTAPPQLVNGWNTLNFGHEGIHCFYGYYHN